MSWDIVDASVQRVISDLSLLIGRQRGHRIIAAGDLTSTTATAKTRAANVRDGMTRSSTGCATWDSR